jgi:DNA-binding Lrp family transcriptional regulator
LNVVVTSDARAFRRAVGVTAWAVLEELVLDADADALVACTNVRRLAAQLGVSKDTVARALNRLARAGIVVRVVSSRGERGALPTSSYAIDLTNVVGIGADTDAGVARVERATDAPARARVTRTAARMDEAQTSLFDLPASAS